MQLSRMGRRASDRRAASERSTLSCREGKTPGTLDGAERRLKQAPRRWQDMPEDPSVADMVEALCLFDEPMLNSRFHALLTRRSVEDSAADLRRLPALALECSRLARTGAAVWDRNARAIASSQPFFAWAERTVLDAFLQLSESQLRVAAHIARSAPDAASRKPFDDMVTLHRDISASLRRALKSLGEHQPDELIHRRNVQEEEREGDIRGQLEAALRAAEASQSGVRQITLSATGLRHLRDQGCFADGVAEVHGHAVSVDLGWDAPAFVIETYDRVGLDEILSDAAEKAPY